MYIALLNWETQRWYATDMHSNAKVGKREGYATQAEAQAVVDQFNRPSRAGMDSVPQSAPQTP